MGNVARPMLAEVLAALTELPADVWDVALAERSPGWHARPVLGSAQVRFHLEVGGAAVDAGPRATWTVTDPADAQETLVARGLLPEGWCGDVRRAWWCAACEGDGYRKPTDDTDTDPYTGGGIWRCSACGSSAAGRGLLECAATIPDLVAVTSLGWDAVHRAEEYALEAPARLREYGCPQPERVVWRVGERGKHWHKVRGCGNAMVTLEGVAYNERSKPKCAPVAALWEMGLALDTITADAVRIVVPPVGGGRG